MSDLSESFSSRDAGRGAELQAQRAAARVERLRAQLAAAERQQRAWSAGGEGERLVARALREMCWPALHDLPWPGRPRANLDHLALSRERIWVIDAKHWSGDVVIRNGVLRQNGYRRSDYLDKARAAAADVAAALGPGAPPVTPVLCLTSSGHDLPPAVLDGVLVVGLSRLGAGLGPAPQNYEELPALVTGVQHSLRAARVSTKAYRSTVQPSTAEPPYPPQLPMRTDLPVGPPQPTVAQASWPYAGLARRVCATGVDWTLLLSALLVAERAFPEDEVKSLAAGWIWLGLVVLFAWLNGATGCSPGKALLGIKVVRDRDGGPLGGAVGVGRALVLLFLTVVTAGLFALLAFVWPLWDRRRRALHDVAVGAAVVRAR